MLRYLHTEPQGRLLGETAAPQPAPPGNNHVGGHPMYNRAVMEQLSRINPNLSPARIAGEVQRVSNTLQSTIARGTFGHGDKEMADMIKHDYSKNWEAFVERVISLFNAGKSEAEISAAFGDVYVEWRGVVSEVKLREEYAPGVAMAMSADLTPLTKGKVLRADYLFLNVEPQSALAWAGCKVGDRISFRAKISKASGPFPEIQLSEFDGDPEVILMVGLYECEFIALV